ILTFHCAENRPAREPCYFYFTARGSQVTNYIRMRSPLRKLPISSPFRLPLWGYSPTHPLPFSSPGISCLSTDYIWIELQCRNGGHI
ncbi:mCG146034, partial [Mus musculus]